MIEVPLPNGQVSSIPLAQAQEQLSRVADLDQRQASVSFMEERVQLAQQNPAYAAALNQIDQRTAQGLPPLPPAETPPQGDLLGDPTNTPPSPQPDPRMQAMESRLDVLVRKGEADELQARLERELAAHPQLQRNEASMQAARIMAANALAANPGLTVQNAVGVTASQVQALVGTQQEFDARTRDMREAPGAPPTSASISPSLQADDDALPAHLRGDNAYDNLKSGKVKDAMLEWLNRKEQAAAVGRNPNR